MNDKERLINQYLIRIAENLDISETMREKAERSYRSVGEWLGDCEENSSVKIMPQGSFYLGTVIRPVSDEDEYDIDLVCLMKDMPYKTEYDIKNRVGNRLKEHKKYRDMLQEEGKRCWTLCYDEFHMDVLPCVPNGKYYIVPYFTEIKLTHKLDEGIYIPKYSNPYKYHEWFEERMQLQVHEARKAFSIQNNIEIDKIPLYKIKTPLQRAVQILKRHRDIMFANEAEEIKKRAPISIIITTLAAHAYNNEESVYEALKNILTNMDKYIENNNGEYVVKNPVLKDENFAEKWNEDPARAEWFFAWLRTAKREILDDPISCIGLHNVAEKLSACFGSNIVRRALRDEGVVIRQARDAKGLYVDGLKGGVTTTPTDKTKRVGGHTFFGK